MYNLYREKCDSDGKSPVTFWEYDNLFSREYNIRFHRPKKDICTYCDAISKLSNEKNERKQEEHTHLTSFEKETNKTKRGQSITEEKVKVVNFDLQKVLITPKMLVSDAYYRNITKL